MVITKAAAAFSVYIEINFDRRANFSETIADEISGIGDELLETAHLETGLPLTWLTG